MIIALCIFFVTTVTVVSSETYNTVKPKEWWQTTTLYQVWPYSFQDSDGDGYGDLNGITSRLEHLVDMGIEVVWLSPIYSSPLVDSGYDISDYRDINPIYGTLDDFDRLVARAKELGIKVIMDYVPNHTSDEHEWFVKSKAGIEPYTDYFVWNEGILVNGTRQPPNNWLSVFNSGSAWKWVEARQAYYLHQFHEKQPDLNFRNPLVIQETKDILTFWLDRGIDGFRIDSMPYLIESASLADEPPSGLPGYSKTDFYYLKHIYVKDQLENYDILQQWRDHIDEYTETANDGVLRVLFSEGYANISMIMRYYESGAHVPFNFFFIADRNGIGLVSITTAAGVKDIIDLWMSNMPEDGTANWVFGNHDNSRVATRYGSERVDAINCLLYLLPGVATIYSGDEIGMIDTYVSWEDTQDPQACNSDSENYQRYSRDPVRTPFQWDNTTSAGFSTNADTMLPVNSNYLTLNLAAQKEATVSHYKIVQKLIALRSLDVVKEGSLNVQVIDESVLAFSRELDTANPIFVVINWDNFATTISLESFESSPTELKVLLADINSGISEGDVFEKHNIELPANAVVVLTGLQEQS